MSLMNIFSNYYYKNSNLEEKEVLLKKPTKKKKKKTFVPYSYESIDNYDNGYRGMFTHKVTPLHEYELFEFEEPKVYIFEKMKPIYEKRDLTVKEKKMILEYYIRTAKNQGLAV